MKTLLVHMEDCPGLDAILRSTLLVTRRFNSHIEAIHVPPGLPGMLPLSPEGGLATADVMASLEQSAMESGQRLHEHFDRFIASEGILQSSIGASTEHPTASWYQTAMPDSDMLANRGRAFSLIIVGRPVSGEAAPSMVTLEAALFESGRPLLIAPPNKPSQIGKRIAIGWNGSTETSRTLALAMPWLREAEDVIVITVDGGMVVGPTGQDIAQTLIREDIPARAQDVPCEGRTIGEALLGACRTVGADLLVKGAYTQSRLRQMIFGGATSHILHHAELPVFMAN